MLFTIILGGLLLGLQWWFSTFRNRSTHFIISLLAAMAVFEAIISLAWEQESIQLRGLWFLAPWAAFPLTIRIEFVYPFLELGHYEISIWLGHLLIAFLVSPSCGVDYTYYQRILCGLIVRVAVFPVFLIMNLFLIPFLYLGFRQIMRK